MAPPCPISPGPTRSTRRCAQSASRYWKPGNSPPLRRPAAPGRLRTVVYELPQFGRRVTHGTLWLLERLRIVPRGTTRVSAILNVGAAAFAEAGRLGIFSPMYFILARKPE